ncbi:Crp/Fnr family transcriptional regulator [Leptolyngbya sp. FACHB-261]|uniref:Crp/Fnr family transcriptional regulator n=1 Tax=Leptolyngbya sp. FACHB-261 TaxID=2692806 RepID=UPI001689AD95|nr:Crp/Fnr family transcriptional regulator [Leptolyngbya sp. FACHB-261]MBD2100574.1 Crp/Fnr family transcriptional regulator [Leptolyngbya sp. FACHB-261]
MFRTAEPYKISTQNGLQNQILAALPREEYERLTTHLQLVSLIQGQSLYSLSEPIEYVYFPNHGVISLVLTLADGSMGEVGLVGREGMVGLPVIWGNLPPTSQAQVQLPGDAFRLKASVLRAEFGRGTALQGLLLRYTKALFTQISQSVVCNAKHTIEERLARWLLMSRDRVQSDEFPLTQEFISYMLGVRRAGVTVAAGSLQRAGIIRYSRGKIAIQDRESLEAVSCECYRTIKTEFEQLFEAMEADSPL